MLLIALMAQAQKSVTIAPVLKTGMQKNYISKGEATTPGSAAADVSGELTYKVVSKTANGFQIDMMSKANKIDATDMMQTISSPDIMQLLNSMNVELLTDKKGCLTAIKNSAELKEKCNALIDSLFNSIINKSPQMKDNEMLKSTMQKAISTMKEMFTDEYLFESFTQTPSIVSLNGKTAQFFKTKTTYSILNGGKTIVQDTKADVDMKSMKAYMIKMMESMMPESVAKQTNPEQMSEMIEGMISNGTIKMDMTRKATYDIGDDGWVKKMVMEMDLNTPNQKGKMRQVITQKD